MTRWRFAWCWYIGCCLLAALPLAAQEEPPEVPPLEVEVLTEEPPTVPPLEVEVVEEPEPSGIASKLNGAAWCVFRSERKQSSEQPPDEPSGVDEQASNDEPLGCDVGIAAALIGKDFRQGRLSLVGVLGAKSLGLGGAWTFGRQGGGPLSVALGLVAPYDSSGVYAVEWAVAVGATVSLFGRR